jgi:hypothetical protein
MVSAPVMVADKSTTAPRHTTVSAKRVLMRGTGSTVTENVSRVTHPAELSARSTYLIEESGVKVSTRKLVPGK